MPSCLSIHTYVLHCIISLHIQNNENPDLPQMPTDPLEKAVALKNRGQLLLHLEQKSSIPS